MTHRVVVTGYGAVSPLGNTADETWQNLIAGTSGIETIKCFDPSDFSVKVAGEVKDFDFSQYADKKLARRMGLFTQYEKAGKHLHGIIFS